MRCRKSLLGAIMIAGLVFLIAGVSFASDYEKGFSGSTREDKSLDTNDPINASNGAYHFSMPLIKLGGPLDLSFTLNCNSIRQYDAYLPGTFWWSFYAICART